MQIKKNIFQFKPQDSLGVESGQLNSTLCDLKASLHIFSIHLRSKIPPLEYEYAIDQPLFNDSIGLLGYSNRLQKLGWAANEKLNR